MIIFNSSSQTEKARLTEILARSRYQILIQIPVSEEQLSSLGLPAQAPAGASGSMAFICSDVENLGYSPSQLEITKLLSKFRKLRKPFTLFMSGTPEIAEKTLRHLLPDAERTALLEKRQREIAAFKTDDVPVVRQIPNSSARAKIEIIRRENQNFVRKTFRPDATQYLNREIEARAKLYHKSVAPITAQGPNYIEIPYYSESNAFDDKAPGLYPLSYARKLFEFIAEINKQGFALLDWNSGLALFDKSGEMHVIDFEYFSETGESPEHFEQSLDFRTAPIPDDPFIQAHKMTSYNTYWRPLIGLSYSEVIRGSGFSLKAKRLMRLLCQRIPGIYSERFANFLKSARPAFLRHYKIDGQWIVLKRT